MDTDPDPPDWCWCDRSGSTSLLVMLPVIYSLHCRPAADDIHHARVQACSACPPLPGTCLSRWVGWPVYHLQYCALRIRMGPVAVVFGLLTKVFMYFNRCRAVFQIRDILVRIRIRILGSVPVQLIYGFGSCFFRGWLPRSQQIINLLLICFAYYFL